MLCSKLQEKIGGINLYKFLITFYKVDNKFLFFIKEITLPIVSSIHKIANIIGSKYTKDNIIP